MDEKDVKWHVNIYVIQWKIKTRSDGTICSRTRVNEWNDHTEVYAPNEEKAERKAFLHMVEHYTSRQRSDSTDWTIQTCRPFRI